VSLAETGQADAVLAEKHLDTTVPLYPAATCPEAVEKGFRHNGVMSSRQPIVTARLRLRVPELADAPRLASLMTAGMSQWLTGWPYPLSQDDALARIEKWTAAAEDRRAFPRLIERLEGAVPMGWVNVSPGDAERSGSLGYWMNDTFQGQGYMSEAMAAVIPAAFEALPYDRIEAGALHGNESSFAIMRRIGMTLVGDRPVWSSTRQRQEVCTFYELTRTTFSQRREA
jgi:RimJ/RimL family protein N-acetyltransferase